MRASRSQSREEDKGRNVFEACTFFLALAEDASQHERQELQQSIERMSGCVVEKFSSHVTHIIALRDVRDLKESLGSRTDLVAAAAAGAAATVSARWVRACIEKCELVSHCSEKDQQTLPLWNVLDHRHCFAGVRALLSPSL